MLGNFFRPESIAIIGASANPKKIGFNILKNLIDGRFPGRIYPVNLKEENILGLKAYSSLGKIRKSVDMAVIAVPADGVAQVLVDCGQKGVKYAVIITSGFAETGKDGKLQQEGILAVARTYGVRLLGPNCLGVISPTYRLNASFSTNMPERKNIAVISQSGATCTAILDWANKKGIGFSHFVSLGNKSDLTENDFLEYFINDEKTEVVLGYLESISDGPKFIELARRLTAVKPFILLKAGKSQAGEKAARSHTAALTGDDRVLSQALFEAGVIRAEKLQDLFEWTQLFADLELPKTDELLILTNAGGPGVMAVDEISKNSPLKLYKFNEKEELVLSKDLPDRIDIRNPLDLQGDATSREFRTVFEAIKREKCLKMVILTPQSNTDIEKIAGVISEYKDDRTVATLIGGEKFREAQEVLAKYRIPTFIYPERAILGLEKVIGYGKHRCKKEKKGRIVAGIKKAADHAMEKKADFTDLEISKLLAAYKIPVADSKLTTNANEAAQVAYTIGYPVVLKIVSSDILHKTEAGGVKIGIENEEVLRDSYQQILRNAKKNCPKAEISGVTVYKMVRSSIEVAIGAKRDKTFGPFVMFSLGGIYIEVFQDFQIRLAPVSVLDAKKMIKSIKSFVLLDGYRNGDKQDLERLAEAISGLSQMMIDFPEISEVDVNPIRFLADGNRIMGLDAKVIFEKE